MPAVVVVGAQWGDEGKGKIIDRLAAAADTVVRFAIVGLIGYRWWRSQKKIEEEEMGG